MFQFFFVFLFVCFLHVLGLSTRWPFRWHSAPCQPVFCCVDSRGFGSRHLLARHLCVRFLPCCRQVVGGTLSKTLPLYAVQNSTLQFDEGRCLLLHQNYPRFSLLLLVRNDRKLLPLACSDVFVVNAALAVVLNVASPQKVFNDRLSAGH